MYIMGLFCGETQQFTILVEFAQHWSDPKHPKTLLWCRRFTAPDRVGLPGLRPWRHCLADVHEMRGTMGTPGSRVAISGI